MTPSVRSTAVAPRATEVGADPFSDNGPTSTQELIEAVFADAPTPGLRSHFTRRAGHSSRLTAVLATAAGKTVLCATVAAASVAGVAVASDRVDLTPAPARPAEVLESVPEVELGPVATETREPGAVDPGPPETVPPVGEEVAELATTTALEGCEKGQAISDAAASGAPTTVEEPDGVDPCAPGADGAAPTTPAGPPEGEPGRPEPVETPAPSGSGADAPGADAKGNGRG